MIERQSLLNYMSRADLLHKKVDTSRIPAYVEDSIVYVHQTHLSHDEEINKMKYDHELNTNFWIWRIILHERSS